MSLLTDIVAYWKLDESSGDAMDSAGSNFTLTNTSVIYDAGLINNGADTGTGDTNKTLSIADNCGIDGGNVTIQVWVNQNNSSTSSAIFGTGSDASQILYYMKYNGSTNGNLEFHRWKVPTDDISNVGVTLSTNTWHHLVLTFDGANLGGYVDNVAVDSVSTSGNGTEFLSNETTIGGYSQLSSFMGMKYDEVGIWSRVLTSDEVSDLYNGGDGLQYPFSITPPTPSDNPSFLLNFV